jgi:hypothetical protein
VVVVALAVIARAAHAVPVTAVEQIGALRSCVEHCRQMRSLGEASRCCGVDVVATDPTSLPRGIDLTPPAPVSEAVLPAAPWCALVPVRHRPEPVRTHATGPPLFLRIGNLLL